MALTDTLSSRLFFPWRNEVSQSIIWITDDGNQTDSLQSINSWLRNSKEARSIRWEWRLFFEMPKKMEWWKNNLISQMGKKYFQIKELVETKKYNCKKKN